MTLAELQTAVDTWIREHGGYWGKFEILARLLSHEDILAAIAYGAEAGRERIIPVPTERVALGSSSMEISGGAARSCCGTQGTTFSGSSSK